MVSININNLPTPIDKDGFISKNIVEKNLDIEFIYGSDFSNAKTLRDIIEVIFRSIWLNNKDISRFILIVDELNNNAIEYGSEDFWENKLRVKLEHNCWYILINIEVEDNWKWVNAKKALDMETLRAHRLKKWYSAHDSIRWRGLFMIIVKSVDRLYFRDSEKWWLIVWIRKKISY